VILSDRSIKAALEEGTIVIDPIDLSQIQPCSCDLRLGPTLLVPYRQGSYIRETIAPSSGFQLAPGAFVLGATLETVRLPNSIVAQLTGKSTLARRGLQVECAGFVDPGWCGELTLELVNLSENGIMLAAGMRICQITFQLLTTPCERPYGSAGLGSHYQNSVGPVGGRLEIPEGAV